MIGYIFSHVKNAIREAECFTCENIAHIGFYLQGLLPKILAIYTINLPTKGAIEQHSIASAYVVYAYGYGK